MCCKKNKEVETSEQKPGWRRCFFRKKADPVLPILMQDVDTYEPVYSGSMSIRSERTYSGNRRRRLPPLPQDDNSAYSNETYGKLPSTPQIS